MAKIPAGVEESKWFVAERGGCYLPRSGSCHETGPAASHPLAAGMAACSAGRALQAVAARLKSSNAAARAPAASGAVN